ncbi:MAG: TMEM175 family protein [Chloroflexaceae bacterium]|nr:TMEM175 family protein [Chloroflexaceae bacterium]
MAAHDARGATAPLTDHIGLERLIFFSDAVFAIAITLLAIEIRLPAGEYGDNAALLNALISLWPRYLSYGVSFLVIGSFWLAHHRMFRHIVRYDRRLLGLNLALLLGIAFVPFPTAVLGESDSAVATSFYALTMAATGLLSAGLWWYASNRGRLLEAPMAPHALRASRWRALTPPGVFLLSVPIAWWSSDLARFSWLLIAVGLLVQAPGRDEALRGVEAPVAGD